MPNILLPDTTNWHNLNTLSSVDIGKTIILYNQGTSSAYVAVSASTPTNNLNEVAVKSGELKVIQSHTDKYVWVRGANGRLVVQNYTDAVFPFTAIEHPHYLYTSDNERYRRLRVDFAQTGFFLGTEGRTFKELNISAGATYVIRAVLTKDIILHSLSVVIDAGSLRVTTLVGGTEGGTFSENLPIINKNNMSDRPTPLYTLTTSLTAGGTHTGGTTLDVLRVVAANATAQQTSVGSQMSSERGIAAGTYYFKLENISSGSVTGVFSGWWEERDASHFM